MSVTCFHLIVRSVISEIHICRKSFKVKLEMKLKVGFLLYILNAAAVFSQTIPTISNLAQTKIKDIGEADAKVELQIRKESVILDNSTRSVVGREGEAVQMECYADGNPPPLIFWRRQRNAALPIGGSIYQGNILRIEKIRREDRGTYYCVAENGVGRGVKREIDVKVEFAPRVSVRKSRFGQALGYDIGVNCHAEAYPVPIFTWIKDKAVVSNDKHYRLSTIWVTEDDVADQQLGVNAIDKKHYGKYICKAANRLGESEVVVELYETAERMPTYQD